MTSARPRRPGAGRAALVVVFLCLVHPSGVFAEGEGAQAVAGPHGWSLNLRATEGWESNPIFDQSNLVAENGSFTSRIGGGFGYSGAGRRWDFTLAGEGGGVFYHEIAGRDTYFYAGGLSGLYRFSPHTSLAVSEALMSDYAQRSPLLITEGIVLGGLNRALTSRSTASLTQILSVRSRLIAHFQYDHVTFSGADTLRGGSELQAGVSFIRTLSRRDSLSLSYDFQRSNSNQLQQDFHQARVGWNGTLSQTTTADASLGATALRQPGQSSWSFLPTGSAGLSVRRPHSKLVTTIRYDHSVSQAFGLGVERVADLASLTLSRSLGRKLSGTIDSGYGFSRDTGSGVQQFSFTTVTAGASLGWAVARFLGIDFRYSYYRSTFHVVGLQDHGLQVGVLEDHRLGVTFNCHRDAR